MIWPDFVASTQGARHLTPEKSLGRGAFDQRKGPHGGEFDQKKIKNVKCPGVSPGEGWALLDLTHTLRLLKMLKGFFECLIKTFKETF